MDVEPTAAPEPSTVRPTQGRRLVLCVVALLLVCGVGGYVAYALSAPRPPEVSLAGLDPQVVKAVQDARAEVLDRPRSAPAWGKLGMVLAAHDLRAEAMDCFAVAERLDPRDPRWPYLQGIGRSLGDPPAAVPKLRQTVALCGSKPDAPLLWLSEVLLEQGAEAEAERGFRDVLKADPQNARAHLGLARLEFGRDRVRECLDHLQFAVNDRRKRQAATMFLAQVARRAGDRAAAARYAAQAEAMPPDPTWPDPYVEEIDRLRTGLQARVSRGERLLEEGRIDDALATLLQATRDYPAAESAWLALGKAQLRQRNWGTAERALTRAISLAPGLGEAYDLSGVALLEQGQVAEAERRFQKAIELKPDDAWGYFNLGRCALRRSKRDDAVHWFQAALRSKPNAMEARRELAALLVAAGRYREATEQLGFVLQATPGDAQAQLVWQQLVRRISPW